VSNRRVRNSTHSTDSWREIRAPDIYNSSNLGSFLLCGAMGSYGTYVSPCITHSILSGAILFELSIDEATVKAVFRRLSDEKHGFQKRRFVLWNMFLRPWEDELASFDSTRDKNKLEREISRMSEAAVSSSLISPTSRTIFHYLDIFSCIHCYYRCE
jgi:hypothetical protein